MLKNNKKIVIIGSAGVGKTTLFEKLKLRYKFKLIPEQARQICLNMGFKNIYEIKDQDNFRLHVLDKQSAAENKYKTFISDRSTIDCWVHWMRWSWNNAQTTESEKYYKTCKKQALKYSHIIYIPRLISPKEDGFRWNDEAYQNQIDRLIKETLHEWRLIHRTYFIKSEDRKSRVKEALEFIGA